MTFQRKTNSFIQHRFGKLLLRSQSFEVSFDRIIYSKTADTSQHNHDSIATSDSSCLCFC